jgi:branched-subunit amino acid transport protein
MKNLVLIVLLMSFATYIPRMLPIVFLNNRKLPPFIKRFLHFTPFAALGALIFPGVLYSTETPKSAVFGCVAAVLLAYLKLNIILVIMGGIGSVFLFELLF